MSTVVSQVAVTGMHCASCGILIDEVLEELPGVTRASTSMRKEVCEVSYDESQTSLEQINAEIVALGYGVDLIGSK
ncbi:MAG: cation transporter [Actinomycetes bacterium]